MAKRIGVFVDVSNIYSSIGKRYAGRKLNYTAYLNYCKDLGDVQQAVAYGFQMNNESEVFIHCLKAIGFTTKYKTPASKTNPKRADWDVGIAIDIVKMIGRLDMVILGTADGDLDPLVVWCREQGVDVIVLACGINRDLRASATKAIEIPESLLESPKNAAPPSEG